MQGVDAGAENTRSGGGAFKLIERGDKYHLSHKLFHVRTVGSHFLGRCW